MAILEEVPSLPPVIEVVFGIDVLLGTTTISRPLYQMTPLELWELKTQLQNLLEYGFIHPSVSPLLATFLSIRKKVGIMRLCIDY